MKARFTHPITLPIVALLAGCASPEICEEQITWAPGSDVVDITKNDRLFICGDPAHNSWKKIPPAQSSRFLQSFLESRAYLNPKISVDYESSKIIVDAGALTRVTAITAEGDVPGAWSNLPLKAYIDRPLTKETLDKIVSDSLELLKTLGYGCGKIDLRAHPDGRVTLSMHAGNYQTFPKTSDLTAPDVRADILARYEPFHEGDSFDIRKTQLAGRRMENDSVASSAQYSPVCESGKMTSLERQTSFGPSRSWEIGFGASTEEYPLAFIRWKSARLWSSASNLRVDLFGSNIRQDLAINLKWYTFPSDRRSYLHPGLEIEHKNEKQYETIETKLSMLAGRTFDVGDWSLEPELGPNLRRIRIIDSARPRTDTLITPSLTLEAHTHNYELYRGNPRTGSDLRFTYEFIPSDQTDSVAVHRSYLQGTTLWNYRDYLEPRWVMGFRFSFGNIFTMDGSDPDPARIPPDWLFLLGGDRDLRGFARKSLPSNERGSGSALTFGFESRWPGLFTFPLDPLLLFDFGWLGSGNARFDYPVYLSPGFGVRSATPLGTIRATLARGMIPTFEAAHTQFFLSFGTEF